MARRRRVDLEGIDRFADGRVESWLTKSDRTTVTAAGSDPSTLGPVIGGLHVEMRLASIPPERREGWALASLAAGHRCRAIVAWARANNIPSGQALEHFLGDPSLLGP